MTKDCSAIDTELLLSQSGWVQSVSRNLVRDPLGAEDVAQETMLAALASPPRYAENAQQLRAWLGKVAFNLAHRNTRRNSRRRAREVRVAKSEELSSTIEDVVRSTELRRVSEAVAALEEPFQTAVRLYYFNRLSTAEIAERTGATDNAVRKRLWRARGKLRALLDGSRPEGKRHGRASAIVAFLFPWLARSRESAGANSSGLFAGLAVSACAAGLLAVAGLHGGFGSQDQEAIEPRVIAAATDLGGATPQRLSVGAGPARLVPETVSVPPREEIFENERSQGTGPDRESGVAPGTVQESAVVIDLSGEPVPGLRLARADRPGSVFESDSRGRVSDLGERASEAPRWTVLTPGWTALPGLVPEPTWAQALGFAGDSARALVVAPAARVHGLVLGAGGEPLDGAELRVGVRPAALARLPFAVGGELSERSGALPASQRTRIDGVFQFANVPVGPGFELIASAEGYGELRLALPSRVSGSGVVLQLTPLDGEESGAFLRGLVLDDRGAPLEGARVEIGTLHTRTDREGRFALALHKRWEEEDEGSELVVAKEGHRTLRRSGFWRTLAARGDESRTVRFQLASVGAGSESALGQSVAGRLVDARGRAVAGWKVAALPVLEDEVPGSGSGEDQVADWGLSAITESDANGAFRIEGLGLLCRRGVVIRVWDPAGTQSAKSLPVPPGATDVRIAVGGLEPTSSEEFSSQLAALAEAGAHGVRFVRRFRSPTGVWDVGGPVVWTDVARAQKADGAPGSSLPRSSVAIVIFEESAGGPADGQFGRSEAGFGIVRTLAFRVRSSAGEAPGSAGEFTIRMLDAQGEELLLSSGVLPPTTSVWLSGGRSPVLYVEDTAHTLVVEHDGHEVSRLEVELSSDSVTTLRP